MTLVQERLKKLVEEGYLLCHQPMQPVRQGRFPYVYFLDKKGISYLRRLGLEVKRRYQQEASRSSLEHTLVLNDVLIDLELYCRRAGWEVDQLIHERQLLREPIKVNGYKLSPDAWVSLRTLEEKPMPLLFELDQGTQDQGVWRRKVELLLESLPKGGAYEKRFGVFAVTIAVVVTAGQRRMEQLIEWTGKELVHLGQSNKAWLFYFTTYPRSDLWDGACWQSPFEASAKGLT